MKKSEQLHICQVLIANALTMDVEDRLEILEMLMSEERVAKVMEANDEQKL